MDATLQIEPFFYREATAIDAADIQNVLIRSIQELCKADHQNHIKKIAAWCENKTIANISDWIQKPENFSRVAIIRNKIVGIGMMQINKITLLYLLPEAVGKGIGKNLLRQLEQHAIQQKFNEIWVESTRTALPFYLAHQYEHDRHKNDKGLLLKKCLK